MSGTCETYTPGYSANAVDFMSRRTAASHAAFFLPHSTVVAARARLPWVWPSAFNRLTWSASIWARSKLQRARERAQAANASVTFHAASVYELPFPDADFDAVFSHALFEHLRDPLKALAELHRVMKPGGCVGLRSPDWGGFVVHPPTPTLAEALADYQELQRSNGGDVCAGRKLAAWLGEAGFVSVATSASYEIYSNTTLIAEYLARQLDAKGLGESAITLRRWSSEPHAMFAQAWFEAVGYKA